MSRITALVAGVAAALALALGASAQTAATTLKGTVGPGFTITLKKNGVMVGKLRHGKYKITVSDKSNIHDFHLKGPGVDKVITKIGFKGSKTVTVTLKKGKYTYVCDPHASIMKHTFRVT